MYYSDDNRPVFVTITDREARIKAERRARAAPVARAIHAEPAAVTATVAPVPVAVPVTRISPRLLALLAAPIPRRLPGTSAPAQRIWRSPPRPRVRALRPRKPRDPSTRKPPIVVGPPKRYSIVYRTSKQQEYLARLTAEERSALWKRGHAGRDREHRRQQQAEYHRQRKALQAPKES